MVEHNVSRDYIHNAERMWYVRWEACREGYHTEREKEQILAKIPNDITLSNDLKNKSMQRLFTYEGRI